MSKIKVNRLENTSTASGGIDIDTSGHVKVDGLQLPTTGPLSNRNLIINGAMQVAQRGTQVTGVTGVGFRTCDRFSLFLSNLGTWTVEQSTDAPDEFSTSFKVLCTTADASPGADDRCNVSYSLEGYDCQRILNTSTTTHPLQLSFWVKSNRTGDASIGLFQPDNSLRLFTASYNISAVNTWQQVTVPIPVDTAAAFNNDSGAGLAIEWWLNGGLSYEGGTHSAGWVAFDSTARNATNLGVGGAVNDYWQITGVQLEVGEKATPFEHRSFADDLNKCKRYLQLVNPNSGGGYAVNHWAFRDSGNWIINLWHYPEMRAAPSLIAIGNNGLTGLPSSQVGLYNISTGSGVGFDNNTGQWDITMATPQRSTLRFTGTNLQGSTGNIAGCDSMIVNTLLFVSAEL
tara:strand:- start:599 stop:1801 length:1203 start_codon:yes stop_codon:yes gene_type:complete